MKPKEAIYCRANMTEVAQATLNPYGPGSVRIHLIPPKFKLGSNAPSIAIVNGSDIIPINTSWAILLNCFIDEVNKFDGKEITNPDLTGIVNHVLRRLKRVYPKTSNDVFKKDLWKIIHVLCDVAYGRTPSEEIGYLTIGEYAPHMRAPHRMDLMVSAMTKNGKWHCNQKCLHCYAAGQPLSEVPELTTEQWKTIIDKCKKIGIPQITFTGGEPTLRKDLIELIKYSQWFVTRVNTNGICLTKDYAKQLFDANLDSIQITYYSNIANQHNLLVGSNNFEKTTEGIKNALEAGLNVSINTPLCTINSNYVETLKFLHNLGITYVSCSGLIVTGNACTEQSKATQLSSDELYEILKQATQYCSENHMEISFTSPGWVSEEKLKSLGLTIPACGACLSNMAIAPDGSVIPCQSWLLNNSLGNILRLPWKKIWESDACKKIRTNSANMDYTCPLRSKGEKK